MKLIHYTTSRLAIVLLIVMACWAVFFYVTIVDEVRDETDDSLKNYKKTIIKQVLMDSTLLMGRSDILTRYAIRALTTEEGSGYEEEFLTTEVYNEYEGDEEPVRMLKTAFLNRDGEYYELTVMTSVMEEDDMLESIWWLIVYLYIALLVCVLVVTQFVFRKSLRPFYSLLEWLNRFTLGGKNEPLEEHTSVLEFRRLNETVARMAQRNQDVFLQQKQFIENASHELQTPLAVCRNKLELLSENPACTEEQLTEIGDIHDAMGRVIRLNKSLLLLSRIENGQFHDEKEIIFNDIVRRQAEELGFIYEDKPVRLQENGIFAFRMNEMLAVTLVVNLLKNALVHGRDGVDVQITDQGLMFSNAGDGGALAREKIFDRFYHSAAEGVPSTGLGLAIVKSIAAACSLKVEYSYDGRHHFKVLGGG